MNRTNLKILLVEDDKSLGQVIEKALKQEGYKVFFVTQSSKALLLAKEQNFDCAVVDCLLPKMNGVQLLQELKRIQKELRSLLITGVYKDKSFFQDALSKTGSYDLLLKPFNMPDVVLTLKHLFSDLLEKRRHLSLELFTQVDLKKKEIKSVFLKEKNFSGFELPYLYSLFFQNQMTGLIHLTYGNKNFMSVRFKEGSVLDVQLEDENSYFGVLLVENGFLSPQELDKALERKRNKPLGEELVDINILSPHVIEFIQKQQAEIRLSKTIQSGNLKFDFKEESLDGEQRKENDKEEETQATVVHSLKNPEEPQKSSSLQKEPPLNETLSLIEPQSFQKLLNEWILSKISLDWLKSFSLPWCNHSLEPTPSFSTELHCWSLAIFSSEKELTNKLIAMIQEKNSLTSILDAFKEKQFFALKAIYFLLICKLIVFKESNTLFLNEEKEFENLKNILRDVKNKNHFQFFGISENATSIDVTKAYYHFANFLHPDRLHPQISEKLKSFSLQVFSHILKAYNVLKNEESRAKYLEKIQTVETKNKAKVKELFDQACSLLYSHQNEKAYKILEKIKNQNISFPHFISHYIWALIKSEKYKVLFAEKDLIAYLESLIHQIPSEERLDENYFYMISLFYKINKKPDLAQKYLKQVVILNPNFPALKEDLKGA